MRKIITVSALALVLGFSGQAMAQAAGGFQGPGIAPTTVKQALEMKDDSAVVLVGQIEKNLGGEKYLFKDATGTVTVEIDNDDWKGLSVKPENVVVINGEVDKGMMEATEIDVESISLKK